MRSKDRKKILMRKLSAIHTFERFDYKNLRDRPYLIIEHSTALINFTSLSLGQISDEIWTMMKLNHVFDGNFVPRQN